MTQPARWEPDRQMVASVLGTPRAWRGMTQLQDADRSWLVAGLTAAGMTAKDIAERLDCSLRLVRSIRAEPMTQLCELMLKQETDATDELRLEKIDHMATRGHLNSARAEANRFRLQLDQIVAKLVVGERVDTFRKCGHPMVRYNVYCHGGLKWCRQCKRDRETARRRAIRESASSEMVIHDRNLKLVGGS